jgi:hypothetical protein
MCDTRLHSLEFPIQFSNSRTHSPTRIRSRAPRGLCLPIGPSNHEGRWSAARRNGNCRRSCVRSRANLRSASPCGAPPTPLDPPAEGARSSGAREPSKGAALRRVGPRIRAGRECEAGRGACARTAKPVRVSQFGTRPGPSPKTRRLDTAVLLSRSGRRKRPGRIQAALSRRRLHSVARRKRHLPVMGADGPPRLPGACVRHTRAVAALHSASRTPPEAPLTNEVIGIYTYKISLSTFCSNVLVISIVVEIMLALLQYFNNY